MRETRFRILDMLAREIGNPVSVSKLTDRIRLAYGTAHYANIHAELTEMVNSKILKLEKLGRSSLVDLNFDNYLLIGLLAEMELIRKHRLLEEHPSFQLAVHELGTHIRNFYLVKSVSLVNPKQNARLNKLELLFVSRQPKRAGEERGEITSIKAVTDMIQAASNIKTDFLFLQDDKFTELSKSKEANFIKEILSDKIVLFHPQAFWTDIKEAIEKGIRIKAEGQKTHPVKISELGFVYNLARFGYQEMGTKITQGMQISMEYIIVGILLKKDSVRRIESIPIILAKNKEKINYNLLVFLATKYNVLRQLCHILKILDKLKPTDEVKTAISELENVPIKNKADQKTTELNLKDIEKKMRLYNVPK